MAKRHRLRLPLCGAYCDRSFAGSPGACPENGWTAVLAVSASEMNLGRNIDGVSFLLNRTVESLGGFSGTIDTGE